MKEAKALREKIIYFLDKSDYDQALSTLQSISDSFDEGVKLSPYLLAELAGSYITLGAESYNLDAVNKGMSLFNDNIEVLRKHITQESIDYCLGNGYHALYKISIKGIQKYLPRPESVIGNLFSAKQAYFRAYKKLDLKNLNDFSIQVLTNLGNNLNHSGRIVEALQLFDMVLRFNPNFPQALVSKADGLIYMLRATNCERTTYLFAQIYSLFKKASEQHIDQQEIKVSIEKGLKISLENLNKTNFIISQLPKELSLNELEYQNHPKEIRFYLDNFISLSEHSLYCYCTRSRTDDLSIGHPGFITGSKKILNLEHLLNRIKSEYSLARNLLYLYKSKYINRKDNILYQNVVNDVTNGIRIERLRTSYRLCFGILDKIAEGICYLFTLDIGQKENIYFESFWGSPTQKQERWQKINLLKNIHLTALYSIACDLNSSHGEFGFYKRWRNRLEHGVFSIVKSREKELQVILEKQFAEFAFEKDFSDKTLHLLQLTRSAIYSFVFCARQELIDK
jgi:tetratricopeptide (TPR) repeat protein